MALSIQINVADRATAAFEKLTDTVEPNSLAARIGQAEVTLFQNHFRQAPSNKKGYPTTGFWPAAAKATNYTLTGDGGVAINIDQVGVRQRLLGGAIVPTRSKHLAIPARAEAYGKLPGDFGNLQLAFRRSGGQAEAFALVEAAATQVTRRDKSGAPRRSSRTTTTRGEVFFWLVNSVNQLPDPSVIPADRDITAAAKQTATDIIAREGGAR